jgi:hypothetical protein
MHFYVETEKTPVAKVVGNAKMHISTKNGTMVPQFVVELAQTMVTLQGRPRELLPGSHVARLPPLLLHFPAPFPAINSLSPRW